MKIMQTPDDGNRQDLARMSVNPATLTHVSLEYPSKVTASGDLDLVSLSFSTGRDFDTPTSQSSLSGTIITEKGSTLHKNTKEPICIARGGGSPSVTPATGLTSFASPGHEADPSTRRRRQWRVRSSCTETVKRKPLNRYGLPGLDEVFVGELKSYITQLIPDGENVPEFSAPCSSESTVKSVEGLNPTVTKALNESHNVEVKSIVRVELNKSSSLELEKKSTEARVELNRSSFIELQKKSTEARVELNKSSSRELQKKSTEARVELNRSSFIELQKKSTEARVELNKSSSLELEKKSTEARVELNKSSSIELQKKSTEARVELNKSSSLELEKKSTEARVELNKTSSLELEKKSTENRVKLNKSSSLELEKKSTENRVELNKSSSGKSTDVLTKTRVELNKSSSDETSLTERNDHADAKRKPRRRRWQAPSVTSVHTERKLPRYEVDQMVELELLFRGLSLDDELSLADVTPTCGELATKCPDSSSSQVDSASKELLCGYNCGSSPDQKTTGTCICDDCWTDDDAKLDLNDDHFYNRESAMSILDIPWEFDLSDPNMPNPCPPTCICKRGRRGNKQAEKILRRGERTTVSLYKKLLDKRLLGKTNTCLYSCCKEGCFQGWFPYSFAQDLLWEYGPSDLRVCHFRWGEWKPPTGCDV